MRPIIPTTAAPAASGLTPRQLSFVLYFNAEESRQLIARLYEAERDLEKFVRFLSSCLRFLPQITNKRTDQLET